MPTFLIVTTKGTVAELFALKDGHEVIQDLKVVEFAVGFERSLLPLNNPQNLPPGLPMKIDVIHASVTFFVIMPLEVHAVSLMKTPSLKFR